VRGTEQVAPRYRAGEPAPGMSRERFLRLLRSAVIPNRNLGGGRGFDNGQSRDLGEFDRPAELNNTGSGRFQIHLPETDAHLVPPAARSRDTAPIATRAFLRPLPNPLPEIASPITRCHRHFKYTPSHQRQMAVSLNQSGEDLFSGYVVISREEALS
jgi:hypothetical protein